jgi:hypothetical protein
MNGLALLFPMMLAQGPAIGGLPLVSWLIIGLVIAGAIAIFWVILKQLNVNVPPFIVTIFWIVVAVLVGVIAIKIIVSIL